MDTNNHVSYGSSWPPEGKQLLPGFPPRSRAGYTVRAVVSANAPWAAPMWVSRPSYNLEKQMRGKAQVVARYVSSGGPLCFGGT